MILIIINFKTPKNSSKFFDEIVKGKYSDVTPDWFLKVGTVILITMIIQVLSTPLTILIFHILRLIVRGWDQG